jgi:hypothetical protein
MAFKLNDVVSYIETTLGSNLSLKGNIYWTNKNTTPPAVKNYGVHYYLGLAEPKEVEYRKIGPKAREWWKINCDFILNKNFRSRNAISDGDGVSYWENYMFSTLFHKQNNGTFYDSWWDSTGVDEMTDSYTVRGIFNCQLDNQY